MLGRARPTPARKVAAKTTSPLRRLEPQWLWGSAAAVALAVAILCGRSDAGAQRIALVASAHNLGASQSFRGGQNAARPIDTDAAIRQLAQVVRGMAEDQDHLNARLAAMERNLDDMTGSISRQIEAAQTAPPTAWPDPNVSTPEAIAAMIAPPGVNAAAVAQPMPEMPAPAAAGYGADIGSATSIKSLYARWTALRSAHPELFEGLRPGVTVRDNPHSNRLELRLVVGPLPTAEAAAQLCISLAAMRVNCQPTMFDSRLALQ